MAAAGSAEHDEVADDVTLTIKTETMTASLMPTTDAQDPFVAAVAVTVPTTRASETVPSGTVSRTGPARHAIVDRHGDRRRHLEAGWRAAHH
jgi:hypothetical protein